MINKKNVNLNKEFLKYNIENDSIVFWCTPVDGNDVATILLNDFLLDISKERKVFFHAYRLPDAFKIIDPAVILAKAEVLLDPFNTFFHLSVAKVKSNCLEWASKSTIYYFEDQVEWLDFLATSVIAQPKKLIKKRLLFAHFTTVDQGADLWFECNRNYEKKVFQLFESMSSLGWEIKRSYDLTLSGDM